MIAPIATALSGALAQSARVDAAAANLANQQSAGALSGQPAAYRAVSVGTTAQAGGGVAAVTRSVTPATRPAYDPSASYADARGMVDTPNVDSGQELLTLMSADLAYKTNLKVVRTADEMTRQALNLTA